MFKKTTVLVTGASGFIGSALCAILYQKGYQIKGVARYLPVLNNKDEKYEFITTGPLERFHDWPKLLNNVDIIIHLASRVHEMGLTGFDDLQQYRQVNVRVTERLIRAAVATGVKRFIFVSSVKAVGEGGIDPYTDSTPAQPTDPYGISKLEAEHIVSSVGEETGIEAVTLRLPLVYGPGVKANFLKLLNLVYSGIPIPLAGVDNRRSMVYMGNLLDALLLCLQRKEAVGGTYFISDGEDLSTPELIRRIAVAFRKPARLIPFPSRLVRFAAAMIGKQREVARLYGSLQVDTLKIRHELAWEPPFSVDAGIHATAQWYLNK